MRTVEIEVTKRDLMTKNELSRNRKNGNIPGVIYGKHMKECFPINFNSNFFSKTINNYGRTILFDFKSEDKNLDKRSALIKEIQKNPITDDILHVDLMEVKQDEKISINIRLNFFGNPNGVKNQGGVLDILRRNVNVSCLPKLVPDKINVDLTNLNLGEAIHISDLDVEEGVNILDAPKLAIASVNLPKAVKSVDEEEATQETIEEEKSTESKSTETKSNENKEN